MTRTCEGPCLSVFSCDFWYLKLTYRGRKSSILLLESRLKHICFLGRLQITYATSETGPTEQVWHVCCGHSLELWTRQQPRAALLCRGFRQQLEEGKWLWAQGLGAGIQAPLPSEPHWALPVPVCRPPHACRSSLFFLGTEVWSGFLFSPSHFSVMFGIEGCFRGVC